MYGFQADTTGYEGSEWGQPLPDPVRAEISPPGSGMLVIPSFETFSAIYQNSTRTYRWGHDEALRHSQLNALAIRRDPVVMDALRSRQMPVAQLPWHLECDDKNDPLQNQAVEDLTWAIKRTPRLQTLLMQQMEAIWYGRYANQLVWSWDYFKGRKQLVIRDHRPVNGDKLIFKWDGRIGILVHSAYKGQTEPTDRGRCHFLDQSERESLLVHRHEPEDADFYEGELAGAIEGVGIRQRIYWLWWLKTQTLAILMEYLERVGAGGMTIYYYEQGNPQSLAEVKKAAEEQFRNNCILFPRYRDKSTGGPGVERVEPSTAGAQLLQALVVGYFDDLLRHFILGQTLTSQTGATGLGSGVAGLHGDTFERIVKYDAVNLQETLTTGVVCVMQRYTYPYLPPLRFKFDVDKPNAEEHLAAAESFYGMGGTIDEDELRNTLGLPKPEPGHSMLAKMSNLSPAATGALPQGIPMIGQPGPDMGAGPGGDQLPPEATLPPGGGM